MVLVFDLGGPLLAYSLLRSAGMSAVAALVISGVLPALGHRYRYRHRQRRNVTARAYTLIRCLAR
jgi:hypothetical protein